MNSALQLPAIERMSRQIYELAEHATLTGALQGGEGQAAHRFNGLLKVLQESGVLPSELFQPHDPQTATYAALAVDARLLSAFVQSLISREEADGEPRDDEDSHLLMRLAPFVEGEDLAKIIGMGEEGGHRLSMEQITSLAPFLPRHAIKGLIERAMIPPTPPTPPTPHTPPAPPQPPVPLHWVREDPRPREGAGEGEEPG